MEYEANTQKESYTSNQKAKSSNTSCVNNFFALLLVAMALNALQEGDD